MKRGRISVPGVLAAAGVGVLLYSLIFHYFVPIGLFFTAGRTGTVCPWPRRLLGAFDNARLERMMRQKQRRMEVVAYDFWKPLVRVRSPQGLYWLPRGGRRFDGPALLAYLEAEHEWASGSFAEQAVRYGDTVVDVGAHVGVFTRVALGRGAARVIAIEPDPLNAECCRRNLAREISAGRVLLVEKGAWSKPGRLALAGGVSNSGAASFVLKESGGGSVDVAVDTLDRILEQAGIGKVDFIKMDIEGAEREALAGARETLRRHRPRLMLDGYHRPDDAEALPRVIREANPHYRFTCGPCEIAAGKVVPHFVYFE